MLPLQILDRKPARIVMAISAVLISALACNIYGESESGDEDTVISPPTASDTPVPDTTIEPTQAPDIYYEGISFSYDESIARHVNVETMPAVPEGEAPPWGVVPEHFQFSFIDYILADTFREARILVYPVVEFEAINPLVVNDIAALATLLETKPPAPAENLPFLPMWNAGALIQTNIEYLNFQNGSGVRYLSQHGQSHWPINNHDLFYTFQGLSSDGRYYVAAILPVSNPALQDTGDEIPGGDYRAFGDTFLDYADDIKILLMGQPNSSFLPDLSILDALFQSIRVE